MCYSDKGQAYQVETWTCYNSQGCVTERGRIERAQPWMDRSVCVEDSTRAAIYRSFYGRG